MPDPQVRERLERVFHDVFDDASIVLRPEMTAADVVGWDSLQHVSLIVAVEREFKIRFATAAIVALKTVGDLEEQIRKKLGPPG